MGARRHDVQERVWQAHRAISQARKSAQICAGLWANRLGSCAVQRYERAPHDGHACRSLCSSVPIGHGPRQRGTLTWQSTRHVPSDAASAACCPPAPPPVSFPGALVAPAPSPAPPPACTPLPPGATTTTLSSHTPCSTAAAANSPTRPCSPEPAPRPPPPPLPAFSVADFPPSASSLPPAITGRAVRPATATCAAARTHASRGRSAAAEGSEPKWRRA